LTISMKIEIGEDGKSATVKCDGYDEHIISKDECETFHLIPAQYNGAIKALVGKSPAHSGLFSPVWSDDMQKNNQDMYQYYDKLPDQVKTRTMCSAPGGEIIVDPNDIQSESVIVSSRVFENDTSTPATFNASISQLVQNVVVSSWEVGGALTLGMSMQMSVGIGIVSASTTYSMSYSQSWGIGGQKSKSVSVGDESGVVVQLQPGKKVIGELNAYRGKIKFQIPYESTLVGYAAAIFDDAVTYNSVKSNYQFIDINDVIKNNKKADGKLFSYPINSKETVEINYYTRATIVLRDGDTGAVMKTIRVPVRETS